VRVEPGVVLDQLNATLAPLGLLFAPTVSPSNRATLGGMVSTDACGKGSRVYGRTSQHVLELGLVLADGTEWLSRAVDADALSQLEKRPDRIGAIYRTVDEILTRQQALIDRQFPKLPRFLTGYDLAHVRGSNGTFDLNRLLTGSEGTLAFITEAKLALVPIPAHNRLIAIRYRCFDDALASAEILVRADPTAIETVDGKILELARNDPVYDESVTCSSILRVSRPRPSIWSSFRATISPGSSRRSSSSSQSSKRDAPRLARLTGGWSRPPLPRLRGSGSCARREWACSATRLAFVVLLRSSKTPPCHRTGSHSTFVSFGGCSRMPDSSTGCSATSTWAACTCARHSIYGILRTSYCCVGSRTASWSSFEASAA